MAEFMKAYTLIYKNEEWSNLSTSWCFMNFFMVLHCAFYSQIISITGSEVELGRAPLGWGASRCGQLWAQNIPILRHIFPVFDAKSGYDIASGDLIMLAMTS